MFEHYLITRFNVDLLVAGWRDVHRILDEDWLLIRLDLFKKYTLPSLINQTNDNFKYIFLIHENTPKKIIKLIEKIDIIYKIIPCLNTGWNINIDYNTFIENDTDKEFIITSAIDSDDILKNNYVEAIQSKFLQEECSIEIPLGIIYDKKESNFYSIHEKDNQFVNLVERRPIKSCYECSHQRIRNNYKSYFLYNTSWIYLYNHGLNENIELFKNFKVKKMDKNKIRGFNLNVFH